MVFHQPLINFASVYTIKRSFGTAVNRRILDRNGRHIQILCVKKGHILLLKIEVSLGRGAVTGNLYPSKLSDPGNSPPSRLIT